MSESDCPYGYAHINDAETGRMLCAGAFFGRDCQTPDLPVLPYAGTSGWSGSDTSRERAEEEDASGVTGKRQRQVMHFLDARGAFGVTVHEVTRQFGWHHGQSSGALSVLHKAEHIARLTEKRDRCLIYVLPKFVEGRETEPHGR